MEKTLEFLKKWLPIFLPILLGIITTWLTIKLNQVTKQKDYLELINKQNEQAYNDKLKIKETENSIVYQKLAFVENVMNKLKNDNSDLVKVINDQRLTIASLVTSVGKLQIKIDSIESHQDFEIPQSIIGKTIPFFKETEIYTLNANVILKNPKSILSEEIKFKDFKMRIGLTRDKKGIFSALLELTPKEFNKYLTFSVLDVSLDKDEYPGMLPLEKKRIDVGFGIGAMAIPDIYGTFGGTIILNQTHSVTVDKGINTNNWNISYKYFFKLLEW